MDVGTARRHGFRVGDQVKVLLTGPAERFRIVGLLKLGTQGDFGAVSFAAFDPNTAQRVFGAEGLFDAVNVRVEPGTSVADAKRIVGADAEPTAAPAAVRGHLGRGRRRRDAQAGGRVPLGAERRTARLRRRGLADRRIHHLQHVHDPRLATVARARVVRARWGRAGRRSSARCSSRRRSWEWSRRPPGWSSASRSRGSCSGGFRGSGSRCRRGRSSSSDGPSSRPRRWGSGSRCSPRSSPRSARPGPRRSPRSATSGPAPARPRSAAGRSSGCWSRRSVPRSGTTASPRTWTSTMRSPSPSSAGS